MYFVGGRSRMVLSNRETKDINMDCLKDFKHIGFYHTPGMEPYVFPHDYPRRFNSVYMFVVDNKIMYVGKSVKGIRRPTNYWNLVVGKMTYQKDGIRETTLTGKSVDIYIKDMRNEFVEYNGVKIYLHEDFETSLIEIFQPPWNRLKK